MASLAVKGIMLSRQKELPKLPVPPLQETLERLWLSLQPILSEQELDASRKAIDKLGERGGEGEYLHRMLTYRFKRLDNWLDEWWLNTAYLDVRTPLPVHSSPAALFPRQTFTSEEDFLLFAAKMTAAMLEFKDLIDRQALPPETARHIPLDMTMYFKIFSMHRMPKPGRDELVSYLDDADPPRHIVVMHNNHLFQVNAYNGRKPFKERDLYPLLVSVVNESRSVAPPVGMLTTEDRDSWTAACQRLAADGTNARSLDAVQRSILVLCLDEAAGEKEPWEVRCPLHMLVGGGNAQCAGNRWLARDVDVIDHRFEDYGKDFVKSCRMSPDSFIQMAFQLSFFRLHGHSPATYESASTRMFLLGRTEAIRSQSKESDKFCREYLSGKINVAERDALLRNAVGVHKDYASLAMYGQGVDRVLLGLRKVAEEMDRPLPELYKDPGYIKSITYELSTSQVSANNDILMTFGYWVPGGYGICYSNHCNQFRFSICTRHCNKETSAVKFRDALETTLKEFGNNLITLQKAKL
ncbi:carnitine O-acetyltransferase-like isoform X6 [Dermacentor variabilis]|uniref:carnitine O-acetyltransferase-like isoform X6 n=1 Tax=Dermacentor variabilis TaxID=34621 RepID=UPI003F5B08C7